MGEEDELSVDEVIVRDLVYVIVNVHTWMHLKKDEKACVSTCDTVKVNLKSC